MTPLPLVAVRKALRNPIKPRVGIVELHPDIAAAVVDHVDHARAPRPPTRSVTAPTNASVVSMTRCSIGSCVMPSISRVMTSGRETWNS